MDKFRIFGWRTASENTAAHRQRGRVRLSLFFHNRLWLGLPFVAIVSFLLFFLLCSVDLSVAEALRRGGIAAVLMVFCWGLGIWASTKPEEKPVDEPEEDWVDRLKRRGTAGLWTARILVALICVVMLVGSFYLQLEGLVTGSEPVLKCMIGILLKALAIVMVLLPVMLSRRLG